MPTRSNGHRCSPYVCPCMGAPQNGTAFHSDPPSSTARLWGRTPGRGPFWPAWTGSQLVTEQATVVSFLSVFPSGTAARSAGTEACSDTTAITRRPKLSLLPTTSLQELVPSLPPREQARRAQPSLLPMSHPVSSNQWFQPSPCRPAATNSITPLET